MKRLISILLALLMLLSGCAAAEAASEVKSEPAVKAAASEALCISELMIKNKCTVTDEDGEFSDYIELLNRSGGAVSTKGWRLSDNGGEGWALPEMTLGAGERILIFASKKDLPMHADFKLSAGETLRLLDPAGAEADSVVCPELSADCAYVRGENGFEASMYASPGYADFDSWQAELECAGPLVINEVMSANIFGTYKDTLGYCDWVEIRNISKQTVELSDYYLSDDGGDLMRWQFPKRSLGAGKTMIVLCTDEKFGLYPYTNFKLDSSAERLYLSDGSALCDYMLLHDIKAGGSMGRMNNENGVFYFDTPTPDEQNFGGRRRISAAPVSLTAEGVFNGVSGMDVELQGEGTIYYTTDGSLPTEKSAVYTSPIHIDSTCVVRACAMQEGCLMSPAVTKSYIINENHTLPVASLVTDNPAKMRSVLFSQGRCDEMPGNLSIFEDGGSFNIGCGVSLSGQNSLTLLKKSLKINFRSVYGEEMLRYDLFGTDIQEFSSINLRSGQDNHRIIFRQEIWQDLAIEMSDSVTSQYSKFCILYLNGEYYGIVCLKENVSEQYYASHRDVSRSSVETAKVPDSMPEEFVEQVVEFCSKNDLSDPEKYAELCEALDMDSFIDWVILEGCSANTDLFRNSRFYRSADANGRWQAALFDLDHAMIDDFLTSFRISSYKMPEHFAFCGIMGEGAFPSRNIDIILHNLLRSPMFRDALLTRFAEVYDTVLSTDSILERIDYYTELLSPEVERDWKRWGEDPADWYAYVQLLRDTVVTLDWQSYCRDCLLYYINATPEEIAKYF